MAVRSNLCNNSSLRNYNKRNLYKCLNRIDGVLAFCESKRLGCKTVLTSSEVHELSKAQSILRGLLSNYKEEYFNNRDLFK